MWFHQSNECKVHMLSRWVSQSNTCVPVCSLIPAPQSSQPRCSAAIRLQHTFNTAGPRRHPYLTQTHTRTRNLGPNYRQCYWYPMWCLPLSTTNHNYTIWTVSETFSLFLWESLERKTFSKKNNQAKKKKKKNKEIKIISHCVCGTSDFLFCAKQWWVVLVDTVQPLRWLVGFGIRLQSNTALTASHHHVTLHI